jgi:prepilin-type N-terminal cleavage/methylation domain-containing protein/prepilin-type processing-associated H-X9-DG protein
MLARSQRRQGFTLVELLVVVAVLAIIAALLFPLFARAKERSRTAACASNMKQLAVAWHLYASDYDETFPLTVSLRSPGLGYVYWMEVIDPYVKGGVQRPEKGETPSGKAQSIYTCPNYWLPAPDMDEEGNPVDAYASAVGRYPLASYAPSIYVTPHWSLLETKTDPELGQLGTLASVHEPSRLVLLGENHDFRMEIWGTGGANNFTRAARRHHGGANYAMVDGHVRWFRGGHPQYGMTKEFEWPRARVCWSKYDSLGNARDCPAYFRPRGG